MILPGPLNAVTDVAGLRLGHATDEALRTGVSVLVGDAPFTAAVHVMGGAPGTRETDLLAPDKIVQQVDALVLSGGSAFGLDAASGVVDGLRAQGRGFSVRGEVVPIVPAAILFDLLNGGAPLPPRNPYRDLGAAAFDAASAGPVATGSVGAGTGAMTADLKGGLGTASATDERFTVGAVVAVNALGRATMGDGPHFWAAQFEMAGEFGGLGPAPPGAFDPAALPPIKGGPARNTTIGIVATDAALTQAQATRLAVAAHDGFARALYPSHTPMDGDLVFAAATGARTLEAGDADLLLLGHMAALCMARAIARGVFTAEVRPGDPLPTWQARFG